jgi:hypothetical protein
MICRRRFFALDLADTWTIMAAGCAAIGPPQIREPNALADGPGPTHHQDLRGDTDGQEAPAASRPDLSQDPTR